MKQVLAFEKGKVYLASVSNKQLGIELLAQESSVPWFEFVVNEQIAHALQPVWRYHDHEVRHLANGGTELVLRIAGQKRLDGLIVEIRKQYFPFSPLTREKLVLKVNGKQRFRLNKHKDKLHFAFPQYALADQGGSASVKETRIGTYAQEVLPEFQPSRTWDQRNPVNNLAYSHMFAPDSIRFSLDEGQTTLIKGPFQTVEAEGYTLFSAYEHASQDTRKGFEGLYRPDPNAKIVNDDAQGVVGENDLDNTDESLWFVGIETAKGGGVLKLATKVLRGAYFENEPVDAANPYETVWTATACYADKSETAAIVHRYIMEQITDHKPARENHYYYNTWGMQRASGDVRAVFTEERIKEEIGYAASLGVDLFVLDDGWEVAQGVWKPNQRLPNGIAPLVDEIRKQGMVPGIWLSPMGIDASAERFSVHQEWVILDKNGNPVKGQWNHPVFDFVSDFYDVFIDDCKWLIDQGVRFFKWDAVNSFPSALAGLHHGNEQHTAQERKDRYDYLLPFYMTRAMRELREYHPDVVVEIDVTEPQRCLVGLMPLQEGKLFWMNNGASGYGDYSTYRTKSMRGIVNRFAGTLPFQVFTFAVYPHNAAPFYAQRYNVNTSLVGGRGFWGNLQQLNAQQRASVQSLVNKQKRVLPYIASQPTQVLGNVGASPELYTCVDAEKAYGQVIGFSGSALSYNHRVRIARDQLLGVLNHSYSLIDDWLELPFQFAMPDDTREAFILGNGKSGVSIVSSTGWIDDISLEDNRLVVRLGAESDLTIMLPSHVNDVQVDGKYTEVQRSSHANVLHCRGGRGQAIDITWD